MTDDENKNEYASPLPPPEMADAFTPEDFQLPRWKIDKQSGNFVNPVTGEEKPTLNVVILKVDKSRFYWPTPFDKKKPPLCFSPNAIYPADQSRKNRYGTKLHDGIVCAGCPMSEWIGDNKPNCAISYNYLLLDIDTDMLAVLNLSRARTKAAKSLNSVWRMNGVRLPVIISTEFEKAPAGDYWQVVFSVSEPLEPEFWLPYARQMFAAKQLQLTGNVQIAAEETGEDFTLSVQDAILATTDAPIWIATPDGKYLVNRLSGESVLNAPPTATHPLQEFAGEGGYRTPKTVDDKDDFFDEIETA